MAAKNWLDETGKLRPEIARKSALIGGVIGAVIWGAVAVAAAIMLVSFGAWGWVVWPIAFYAWSHHVGLAVKAYQNVVAPKKWEQNVTVNVVSELTPEQISEAATRAVSERAEYYATTQ